MQNPAGVILPLVKMDVSMVRHEKSSQLQRHNKNAAGKHHCWCHSSSWSVRLLTALLMTQDLFIMSTDTCLGYHIYWEGYIDMRDIGCAARFYSPELCNIPRGMSGTGGESGVEDSPDSLKA